MTGIMAPQVDGDMEEVPPGALPEEVADDIPAQLSEGEYVVPADVVRWVGLKSLMAMREEAKAGLAAMEAEGQIGGDPMPAGEGFAGPAPEAMEMEEALPEPSEDDPEAFGFAQGGMAQNQDFYTEAVNAFAGKTPTIERYVDQSGRVGYRHLDANGKPIGAPDVSAGSSTGGFGSYTPAESQQPTDFTKLTPQQPQSPVQAPEVRVPSYEGGGPGDDSGDPNHGAGEHEMDPNKSFGENLADWGGEVGFGLTAAGSLMSPMATGLAIGASALTGTPALTGTTVGTLGRPAHQNVQDIGRSLSGGWSSSQSFADQAGGASLGGNTAFGLDDPTMSSSYAESEIGLASPTSSTGGSDSFSSSQSFGGANVGGNTGFGYDDGTFSGMGNWSDSGMSVAGGGGGADGNNGAGGSSDNRVICTHFYKKGELSRDLWAADTRWTMLHVSAHTQRGYQLWGVPYVKLMRKYKILETIVRPLALHRANEIGYQLGMRDKPDYIGKLGRVILEGISWCAGWLPMEPISYKTLYTK